MNRRQFLTTGGVTAVTLFFSNKLKGLNPQIMEPALNVQGWDGGGWSIGANGSTSGGWSIAMDSSAYENHKAFLPIVTK